MVAAGTGHPHLWHSSQLPLFPLTIALQGRETGRCLIPTSLREGSPCLMDRVLPSGLGSEEWQAASLDPVPKPEGPSPLMPDSFWYLANSS